MKLNCLYTLKQPLSHIGENESTVSFLNTVRIVSGNKVEEVFAYTGNAIRGALRDCGAKYLMDTLRNITGNEDFTLSKKMFHILFSGGNITGEQKNDINQVIDIRSNVPFISLFGAGIGNQILAGKITQGFAFPICSETTNILPDWIIGHANYNPNSLGWKQLTGTIQFSRKDDLKDVLLNNYSTITSDDNDDKAQMRYEVEYVSAGTQLYHEIILDNINGLEMGAFLSCLENWSKKPILGGMSSKGFGLTNLVIYNNESKEEVIKIENSQITMCEQYKAYLQDYNNFIIDNYKTIMVTLGG